MKCKPCRYFLRKLRKVKKMNGQILATNEVRGWDSHLYQATSAASSIMQ